MAFRRCYDSVIIIMLIGGRWVLLYLISFPYFEFKEEVYKIQQKLFDLSKQYR